MDQVSKRRRLKLISHDDLLSLTLGMCVLINASAADSSAQEFDLIEAQLNGKTVFGLTVDALTDSLGRPSFVEPPKVYKRANGTATKLGTKLMYHAEGIQFSFEHPESGQGCIGVQIFLSRTWDEERKDFYLPFKGKLTKNVTGDWKAKRVMEEFSDANAKDNATNEHAIKLAKEIESAEILIKEMPGLGVGTQQMARAKRLANEELHCIYVERPKHLLKFFYEPNTRFLEKIFLARRSPAATN